MYIAYASSRVIRPCLMPNTTAAFLRLPQVFVPGGGNLIRSGDVSVICSAAVRFRVQSVSEPVVLSRKFEEPLGDQVRRRGLRHFPEVSGTLSVMGCFLEPDK